jgi:hypothetical protein
VPDDMIVHGLTKALVDAAVTPKDPKPETWPEIVPLPIALPPVMPFRGDLLPEAFRPWVTDIAERVQCPADFPAVAAIVTAASVVGRQMGIYPKRKDDWLVIPNLWGGVVGRPSVMKTPAMAEPMKMIDRLSAVARENFSKALEDHGLQTMVRAVADKAGKDRREQAIKKALAGGGDAVEALRAEMNALPPEPPKPILRRYKTNDPTVEKLGELMNENPRGFLLFRDELVGFLRNLDRDGREGDRPFYLESWNGSGSITYDRIGRGTVDVDAVCLSILGGIQPGPLRAYISQATDGGAGDDGLLQRMQLLVWPDTEKEWRNVDRWPNTDAKNLAFEVYQRLDNITPDLGRDVPAVRFDAEGQGAFDDWRETLERRLRNEDMPAAFEAHMAKYRSLMPSLALLFHLIDTPDATGVGAEQARRAIAWCEYLETHARRLYAQHLNPEMVAAVALADRLRDLPDPFTARDVSQKGWQGLDREAVNLALPVLTEFGHIVREEAESSARGGRPTARYLKNPWLAGSAATVGDDEVEL